MFYSINMEELDTNVTITNKPWGFLFISIGLI